MKNINKSDNIGKANPKLGWNFCEDQLGERNQANPKLGWNFCEDQLGEKNQANPKLGWNFCEDQLGEKNQLGPLFFSLCTSFILTFDFFPRNDGKTKAQYPQFKVFYK